MAALFFVTTHWGPPGAAAADLSEVPTPADFPGEIFSSLDRRTTRIEVEVPKTDLETLGWFPAFVPGGIPPDPAPRTPLKLRGWYISITLSLSIITPDGRRLRGATAATERLLGPGYRIAPC